MNVDILEHARFTKGEIKVYIALLEIGETTTGPIIRESGISSSKVYEILNKLINKGLASYTTKERTKYFQAASPKRINDYLNKKKIEFIKNEKQIKKLIPILEQKHIEQAQQATVYEGIQGAKSVFKRIRENLKKGDEYYVFTGTQSLIYKELRIFLLNHHTRRIKKGIKVKILSEKKYKSKYKKLYPKFKLSERRFVKDPFPNHILIFKNNVVHFIYKPNTTLFVLTSKQNFESYKKFFLDQWKKAEKW